MILLCNMKYSIVMKQNWTLLINRCQLHFTKLNIDFIQLLALNFGWYAVGRFQKTAIDDINSRQSNSHHNLLFMQSQFWKVFWFFHLDQAVELIICNCHKESIFHHNQEMVHLNSAEISLKHTLKCQALWLFQSSCGIRLSSFFTMPIFLVWYCGNADTHWLRHFSDTLTLVLFNNCF